MLVQPYVSARATAGAPTDPTPPALFSITTGCWSAADIFGERRRATKSADPPGAKGTTILTGRRGKATCANSAVGAASEATPPAASNWRLLRFIVVVGE